MDLIVASRTFSREDWVHMRTYSAVVTGLHNTGFTRRIAQYLRFCHDVPYRRFYDDVIEEFVRTRFMGGAWWKTVEENLTAFLADADASDALDAEEIPGLGLDLRQDDWVTLQVGLHCDAFFDALGQFLAMAYPVAPGLDGVVEYQRRLVITPDYDPTQGRRFESEFEWSLFFEDIDRLVQYEPRREPAPADPATMFEIRDVATGLRRQQPIDWAGITDPDERLVAWARAMVRMEHTASSQCFDLPGRVPAQPLVSLRTPPPAAE
jgi:hypothetical protein